MEKASTFTAHFAANVTLCTGDVSSLQNISCHTINLFNMNKYMLSVKVSLVISNQVTKNIFNRLYVYRRPHPPLSPSLSV